MASGANPYHNHTPDPAAFSETNPATIKKRARNESNISGEAKSGVHLDDLADLAVRDGNLDAREVGVESPLQGRHELHVRGLAGVDGLDRLGHVGGDRLLAEHVLAVSRAGLDLSRRKQHTYGYAWLTRC